MCKVGPMSGLEASIQQKHHSEKRPQRNTIDHNVACASRSMLPPSHNITLRSPSSVQNSQLYQRTLIEKRTLIEMEQTLTQLCSHTRSSSYPVDADRQQCSFQLECKRIITHDDRFRHWHFDSSLQPETDGRYTVSKGSAHRLTRAHILTYNS